MDEWLTRRSDALAAASGTAPTELALTDSDVATILDLAGLAAHESGERTNAPLLCYLIGKAAVRADLDTLAAAVRDAD
jgi:Domain of unknown function (DUF6457)